MRKARPYIRGLHAVASTQRASRRRGRGLTPRGAPSTAAPLERPSVKVALLPAKLLSSAKTRLGAMLGDAERMTIAAAMFDDVLHALRRAAALDAVLVITADARLAARARQTGALVIDEGAPRGLNGA